jgi:hypothetical protein
MITFPCPSCGAGLRIAPEHAGMLVGCAACGDTVQAPTSAIAEAPTAPVAAPASLPSATVTPTSPFPTREEVFYDEGKVLVTESQLIIGRRTYPLRHIVSVEKFRGEDRVEHTKSPMLIVGLVGSCLFLTVAPTACMHLGTLLESVLLMVIGWLLMLLSFCPVIACICLMRKKVPQYGLGLVEKGGYVEELLFRNRDLRDKVFDAVGEALEA